ncbi:MAG: RDD family protein [Saprospiraceae bacterium]|nr:RDD family protein [Saprospiraceae bacterium]
MRNHQEQRELDLSFEEQQVQTFFKDADKGKRFINYLIDRFCATVLFYTGMFLIVALLAAVNDGYADEDSAYVSFVGLFFGVVFYGMYYIFFEFYNKGKTLGKMATRTRVVNMRGEHPSFGQIVGRTFSRMIPFDAWSVLLTGDGRGFHDLLSGTRVVEDK